MRSAASVVWKQKLGDSVDENISFFLVEIKLYKIGTSDPAVKFEIIEKPNNWTKEVKKQSTTTAPAQQFQDPGKKYLPGHCRYGRPGDPGV